MNKIGFIFSGLFVFLGTVILFTTSIINKVLPKMGYAVFQAAAAGSYSDLIYIVDFKWVNVLAVLIIIVGIYLGYRFYKEEKGKE